MNSESILKNYGLNKNENLEALSFDTHEDWLKLRTKGIGGSDIGAIMGLNKYSSPLQVYKSKVEGFVKDLQNNIAVRKGKDLESLIRTLYVIPHFKDLGYDVRNMSNHTIVNKQYPWLRANLDGIAIREDDYEDFEKHFVIEIKFVSFYSTDNWNKDEYCGVPPYYYAQVQEYMLVTGMRKAYVCAMFEDSWECQFFPIQFNPEFATKLVKMSKEFFEGNVLMKIPPKIIPSIDTEEAITKLKQEPQQIIEDPKLNTTIADYLDLGTKIKNLKKDQDNLKDEIIEKYLNGNRPTSPLFHLKVSTVSTTKFDTTKFKEEHPDLYEEYVKNSEYIKLSV